MEKEAVFFLGGGFKYFFMFTPYLGTIPNLTNIFQGGWFNHHLVFRGSPEHLAFLEHSSPEPTGFLQQLHLPLARRHTDGRFREDWELKHAIGCPGMEVRING